MVFKPSVYNNQRPILTAADLDNHPLAADYLRYIAVMKYPPDFKTWLQRIENEKAAQQAREAMEIAAIQKDPYCRSPLKIRIHHRSGPGRYNRRYNRNKPLVDW